MFSHQVSIVGYIAIGLGVICAMASGQMFFLGAALEAIGTFLILLGVIAQGFLRIEKYLSGHPQLRAGWDAHMRQQANAGEPWKDPAKQKVQPIKIDPATAPDEGELEAHKRLRELGLNP